MSEGPSDDWELAKKLKKPSSKVSSKTMADLLFLPKMERSLMNWLLRQQKATLAKIADRIAKDLDDTLVILEELSEQGFLKSVECEGEICYQPCLVARKQRSRTQVWDILDE
ncbi:MAG: hypothetical protein QNJ54_10270 [Prochloraceae cyanobacterium]|nr:hypothetical protein [Prochloraceae cyanobacterium]